MKVKIVFKDDVVIYIIALMVILEKESLACVVFEDKETIGYKREDIKALYIDGEFIPAEKKGKLSK